MRVELGSCWDLVVVGVEAWVLVLVLVLLVFVFLGIVA